MALLSPILLICLVFSANTAFDIMTEQKVAAAAYSGANYFQDRAMADGLDGLRPTTDPDTGEKADGEMVKTAKLVIQDAYGQSLDLSHINVSAYCGCPKSRPDMNHGFDESDTFYSTSAMSTDESQDVCPTNCSDSNASRVIAEIDITHQTKDLFGNSKTVTERLVTRLR